MFEATHRLVLQFVADGLVDGLRVDHVDGLLEPRRYLERLRAAVDARRPAQRTADAFPDLRREDPRAGRDAAAATGRWTAPRATSS